MLLWAFAEKSEYHKIYGELKNIQTKIINNNSILKIFSLLSIIKDIYFFGATYTGPFPAILGKGPLLELGKICSILGIF